jgi:hypothetical protein
VHARRAPVRRRRFNGAPAVVAAAAHSSCVLDRPAPTACVLKNASLALV